MQNVLHKLALRFKIGIARPSQNTNKQEQKHREIFHIKISDLNLLLSCC